jgi:hypothetical protein
VSEPSTCYIMGRKAVIASNGHEYIAEPFIVFPTKEAAEEAADMVFRVSGERPMIVEAAAYKDRRP